MTSPVQCHVGDDCCPSLCCVCCSHFEFGIPVSEDDHNAVLLGAYVDPNTSYAYVAFSRPLVTSDVNDADLSRPLYLHFGFGPFNASSPIPVSDPGANRWVSTSPIQFDCDSNRKSTLQQCSTAVCIVSC